ncbi:MAG: hypothetical protein NT031_04660 [Planctomycetota bacterium]|nr:hypothetical protein [Planctomycetota bacterium]
MDEKQESIPDSNGRLSWRPEKRFTGQLTIRFDRAWFSNLRATWADGKRQRLENVLSSVITGLLERIDYEKRTRLDRQIEARQGQKAVERREAGQRRAAEEQNRRKRLKVEVARWHYAQRIRQYLATIEAGIAEGKLRARDPDAFAGWIEWANWYADDIDPLVDHEPLPEENCPPTNAQLADIELTSHTRPIIERLGVKDAEGLYSLTRDAVRAAEGDGRHGAWGEVCNVLEGLGYDVSGRRSWY